ncbi:hypothetical protein MHYP_G00039520 [Metynnis hypsauchen]
MSLWMILPVSLPALTITGIWVVYAMALYNQHVCPVDNCKCGTLPPESCFFSLICSTGSFMSQKIMMADGQQQHVAHSPATPFVCYLLRKRVQLWEMRIHTCAQVHTAVMVIVLLRYAHVIEKHQNCVLNTASLSTGWICSAGLIMVGNFQVDNAKVLHYVGAGVAFPTSMLFVCLQSALTYRLAKTQGEYNLGHLRLIMTLLAFVALVLSGVFFVQESFVLQHASAIFEWVFCVIIMLFYGTFAFEFAGISSNTMMVLARGGTLGSSRADHKMESLSGASQHQSEKTRAHVHQGAEENTRPARGKSKLTPDPASPALN